MSDHKPATAPANKPGTQPVKLKTVKLTPEQKAAKFKKLATARANRAIKVIGHIGNLSGSNYVYTEKQVETIFAAMSEAIEAALARFSAKAKTEPTGIQL